MNFAGQSRQQPTPPASLGMRKLLLLAVMKQVHHSLSEWIEQVETDGVPGVDRSADPETAREYILQLANELSISAAALDKIANTLILQL